MAHTATTSNSASPWRPDQHVFDAGDVLPDALILTDTLAVGAIEGDQPVIEVAYVVDDDAQFVAEGDEIPEGEPGLAAATIYSRKIAQLIRLTSEQYRQNNTPAELARSVSRALTRKADQALLAQAAPTAPAVAPVAGILNTTGLSVEVVEDGNLDALIDLEASVRAAGANPTAWVLAPATWAEIRKFKTAAASNQNLLGAGTENAQPLLLGIPVKVNPAIPSGSGVLLDQSAILTAAGPVTVTTDPSAYFAHDSIGIRATWRTGHVLPRPDRIGKFTIDDGEG
ncbi:phage major capsid protein [Gordonia sp. PP30]|uniref:phage major capsid protein n=1 Tax=Gordonia sp. PP30 TaxID=2935861 RepID=UPI001FFE3AC3|nr:phage major capsid protein [Gordonia sp. PP30]UQE74627.1 phage major capsid protein [Gordonia sp. PP30]